MIGIAHFLLGQLPELYVVLADPSAAKATVARLKARLAAAIAARLGRCTRPRRVRIVDVLPRTRSGKVVRRELKLVR
ncbi:AMP-binding enzyme [Acerihabitans arboris]|uniref:AMP-binding enzyme C-terminal domain-containing protein n=1 Tax=Acerihabitans arboris TaxID=2691583 RepID=A0A845SM94_9GAMM|nr:hypothetical protein [Acerihabitans arboris]NDL64096.1 hypothetical protein [Acerihabitans arboris]